MLNWTRCELRHGGGRSGRVDGVHLATDICVPERAGPATGRFPAVVERTPYNKASTAGGLPKYFVPRGYAVVVQDVHGQCRSGGTWRPLQDDGPGPGSDDD